MIDEDTWTKIAEKGFDCLGSETDEPKQNLGTQHQEPMGIFNVGFLLGMIFSVSFQSAREMIIFVATLGLQSCVSQFVRKSALRFGI